MPDQTKDASLPEKRYRIFETDEYIKRVSKLRPNENSYIQNKCAYYVYPQLKSEPHFGTNIKKLTGYEPKTWRYRIGDFRLFYSIDERAKIVFILTVEQRKNAYR
ncbi:MAG: type II toxin-antitoxin system RelE/ParE family toxin [Chitinispirillaceae bacterium]|nr:type II toxin-antitoxin system RelE/ParE family toxin [Chitinispirillaceae bacterium]